jgi:hypothetical protein
LELWHSPLEINSHPRKTAISDQWPKTSRRLPTQPLHRPRPPPNRMTSEKSRTLRMLEVNQALEALAGESPTLAQVVPTRPIRTEPPRLRSNRRAGKGRRHLSQPARDDESIESRSGERPSRRGLHVELLRRPGPRSAPGSPRPRSYQLGGGAPQALGTTEQQACG